MVDQQTEVSGCVATIQSNLRVTYSLASLRHVDDRIPLCEASNPTMAHAGLSLLSSYLLDPKEEARKTETRTLDYYERRTTVQFSLKRLPRYIPYCVRLAVTPLALLFQYDVYYNHRLGLTCRRRLRLSSSSPFATCRQEKQDLRAFDHLLKQQGSHHATKKQKCRTLVLPRSPPRLSVAG